MEFKNGKAIIKKGRKIIAKVYDRPVFFANAKTKVSYSKRYSLDIPYLGIFQSDDFSEIERMIEKHAGTEKTFFCSIN